MKASKKNSKFAKNEVKAVKVAVLATQCVGCTMWRVSHTAWRVGRTVWFVSRTAWRVGRTAQHGSCNAWHVGLTRHNKKSDK